MTTRTAEVSPQGYARIAGVLYLIIVIDGALDQIFIRGRLIVPGDAVSTAGNLMASQSLWLIVKGVNVPKWEKRAAESA